MSSATRKGGGLCSLVGGTWAGPEAMEVEGIMWKKGFVGKINSVFGPGRVAVGCGSNGPNIID